MNMGSLFPRHARFRDDLMAWTNARVAAKFQRIVDVVVYAEFPRNVAGKTLKREMRDAYTRP